MMDNLNEDVIERYAIYLASRELGESVSDEEEEKMMGRLVNSELKKRIEFLKNIYVGIYKQLDNHPLGHIWIEKLGIKEEDLKNGWVSITSSGEISLVSQGKTL